MQPRPPWCVTIGSLALLLSLSAPSAADTVYKSVGPNGKVIYSDRPPEQGKIDKTLSFKQMPASPPPAEVLRAREAMKMRAQATPTAGRSAQLFSAQWCGYCRKAKAYLAEKNIPYDEHDIDTAEGKQAFAQIGVGSGIPVLVWQNQHVQGYSRAGYDALFATAGR